MSMDATVPTLDATVDRLAARMVVDPVLASVALAPGVRHIVPGYFRDVHFAACEQIHIWAAIHGVTFDDLRGRLQPSVKP